MSFFDEADEPPRTPRREPRRPGPSGPSGRGRPPGDQQSIQTRRTIAIVVIVVIVVLMGLLIHSCQVSQRNSALKDYNDQVYSLIQRSDTTGSTLFSDLTSGGGGASEATTLYGEMADRLKAAQSELGQANGLSVPGQMSAAQQHLVLALQMRRDGIATIASNVEKALGTLSAGAGVQAIAGAMSDFYASDVVYKSYAAPAIAEALNAARLDVTGTINGGQFLPDLGWLQTSFIAGALKVNLPASSSGNSASQDPTGPGLHGHALNSVSVGGTTLVPGGTATLAASPAPTFQLNLTNGGQYDEYDVGCKVSIEGLNDTGTSTISETTPQETTNCSVTLPKAPAAGSYTVTAEVVPVPQETNTANNSESFTITFS